MDARRALVWALIALSGGLALAGPARSQENPGRIVDIVEIRGVIDPPIADYLRSRLAAANAEDVAATIIQLDTPGGLDVSIRTIVTQILDSDVPVVVWIAPRSARAASAGTFIAYASNLIYMAESTEIGPATPINLGGGETDARESGVTDEEVDYLMSIGAERGRNLEWAEDAIRSKASIGAAGAAEIGAVDGIASSLRDLLAGIDGKVVQSPSGRTTIETWEESTGAPSVILRFNQMQLVGRLLHAVTDPEIAYMLLLAGMFGIIFELYNPGIGLAGILGAGCLLLGIYALSVLPTTWVGVLLTVVGVVLLMVDLQRGGLGVYSAAGVVAFVGGGALIFHGGAPAVQLNPWAIVAALAGTLVFFFSVMTAALRVRLRRPVTGDEAIVGSVAEATTDIAPEGTVVTKGTLWRARTMETGIAAGSPVKVMATEGSVLLVEPFEGRDPDLEEKAESPPAR